jgi:hypothetical protein
MSASGRSPLRFPPNNNLSLKEFALRAQADRMSALPTGAGTDSTALGGLFAFPLTIRSNIPERLNDPQRW